MIKNYAQMERELKENMRGGKGTVELVHIFRKDELKGNARLCAKIAARNQIPHHNPGDTSEEANKKKR
jgi:hypothetical protein